MATAKHLELIKKALQAGTSAVWNEWRASKYRIDAIHGYMSLVEVDLSGADLSGLWSFSHLDLADVNFQNAELKQTNFHSGNLRRADLRGANLSHADLRRVVLDGANLSGANLRHTNLGAASLIDVNLSEADLYQANLTSARLQRINLEGANLSGCKIYGVSAWDLKLDKSTQSDLIITSPEEPTVTVDNLEVAQFIYLLLKREKLRNVIDTITSKTVLILGRFTPAERKKILDVIANELRKYNLLPIIFDFERSSARDFTETIKILASLSLFVIVDMTNPKSTPLELQATVPDYQIPFVPILQEGENPFAMFNDLWVKYKWVLEPVNYSSPDTLSLIFETAILDRAWEKHRELQKVKTKKMKVLSWKDFLREEKVQAV